MQRQAASWRVGFSVPAPATTTSDSRPASCAQPAGLSRSSPTYLHTGTNTSRRHEIDVLGCGGDAKDKSACPGSDRLCSPAVVGRSEEGLPTRPPDQASNRHPPTRNVTTAAVLPFLSGGQWDVCSSLAEER